MTEILGSHILSGELSRSSFLKGGGAMVVGFSLLGGGLAGRASAADSPYASNGPGDMTQLDAWLTIHADNTATIRFGKVELGTGNNTGLVMIAAEELGMEPGQFKIARHDTNVTPNQGETSGSNAISSGGQQVRAAAAAAAQALLGLAGTSLGVPTASLTVSKGAVSGGGKTVTYGALIGDKLFNVQIPAASRALQPGVAPAKPVAKYSLVGLERVPRIDIPAKVTGAFTYVHQVRVPGMLHGRVVRPRGQGQLGSGAPVVSVDESSIKHIKDVQVVRRGDFVGVVAKREYDAIQAAAQLKVKWADPPALPSTGNAFKQMREDAAAGKTTKAVTTTGDVDAALASAAHTASGTFTFAYNAHVPIGPVAAVADVTSSGARIFTNSQDLYNLRTPMAKLLGLDPAVVRLSYYEGSSVFGWSQYNDAALSAALLSQTVGKPVRVQYMRWDEHGWDNFAPTLLADVKAGVDAQGNIVGYDTTYFSTPLTGLNSAAPENVLVLELIGSALNSVRFPFQSAELGNYAAKTKRTVANTVTTGAFLKNAPLRAPGAPAQSFVFEQIVDDLAHAAGMDPLAFRIQNIASGDSRERWLSVLNAVGKAANWKPKVAASKIGTSRVLSGRGIATGTFAGTQSAMVADIDVDTKTGKITVKHLYTAQNAGLTVSLDGVENQMVGAAIQGVSRGLVEGVTFNTTRVTATDWVTYPILRFKDSPKVTPVIVQATNLTPTGSGEPPTAAAPAAVANAFFDATGVRLHDAPMTPARVRAALAAAKK